MAAYAKYITSKTESMALAADIIHGNGPRNKMHPQLQPKKIKAKLN